MTYLPTTAFQLNGFLYSAGLGFALGLVYDFFRILFFLLTGNDKKYAVARDIIFMTFCMFAVFIYMLVMCEGQILFYALAGTAIGFLVYLNMISNIFYGRLTASFRKIRRFIIHKSKYVVTVNRKIKNNLAKNKIFQKK